MDFPPPSAAPLGQLACVSFYCVVSFRLPHAPLLHRAPVPATRAGAQYLGAQHYLSLGHSTHSCGYGVVGVVWYGMVW